MIVNWCEKKQNYIKMAVLFTAVWLNRNKVKQYFGCKTSNYKHILSRITTDVNSLIIT